MCVPNEIKITCKDDRKKGRGTFLRLSDSISVSLTKSANFILLKARDCLINRTLTATFKFDKIKFEVKQMFTNFHSVYSSFFIFYCDLAYFSCTFSRLIA